MRSLMFISRPSSPPPPPTPAGEKQELCVKYIYFVTKLFCLQ
jgi:hypothetical protein